MHGSPLDSEQRGSHISLKHPDAYRICRALIEPSTTKSRLSPTFANPTIFVLDSLPFIQLSQEIRQTVERMKEIMETKEFETFSNQRNKVT